MWWGGVGNQLFQYANACAIAWRNGAELVLDLRDVQKYHDHRRYALMHFALSARVAGHDEFPSPLRDKLRYHIHYLWASAKKPRLIRERSPAFNQDILTLTSGCYLYGWFQSERYFEDCSDRIRNELQFITPPGGQNGKLLERIEGGNAVSVHVRRGDYLNSSGFAQCSTDYYDTAIAHIAERVGSIKIYVFSDDPEWVRRNMNFDYPTIISDKNQEGHAYEDLRLMAACRHHVIANSSFSWWGAWLNPDPDKIVVAPKKWFVDGHPDNPDIVPEGWHRMAN
ncbi:MAG: alpha-1,2-fucosyltransferase [Rhodobacteraceae bacterium]|nr:alpha-1,2-fucosyltransferase [Paracoccaceae bacterium]